MESNEISSIVEFDKNYAMLEIVGQGFIFFETIGILNYCYRAYGSVYKAQHKIEGTIVAVKSIPASTGEILKVQQESHL